MRLWLILIFLLYKLPTTPGPEELPCFFSESIKWELISYKDVIQETETERPWRFDKLFKVIIQFDYDEETGAGTFEGQSLSNVISGSYDLTEEGIQINHFEDSQMREPAWGLDSMRIAMSSVYGFQCDGDTLLLQYKKGRSAMVFVKTEAVFYDWDEYMSKMGGSSSID